MKDACLWLVALLNATVVAALAQQPAAQSHQNIWPEGEANTKSRKS